MEEILWQGLILLLNYWYELTFLCIIEDSTYSDMTMMLLNIMNLIIIHTGMMMMMMMMIILVYMHILVYHLIIVLSLLLTSQLTY